MSLVPSTQSSSAPAPQACFALPLQANAGGALLAMAAAVCGPWLVGSGLLGRWLIRPPREGLTLAIGLTIVLVTLTQWTVRISLGW